MNDQGQILRRARTSSGMSLRQFAKLVRIDFGYLSRVERGLQQPSIQVVNAYMETFGEVMERRDLLRGLSAAFLTPSSALDMIYHGFDEALSVAHGDPEIWLHRVEEHGRDYMMLGARGLERRISRDLAEIQCQMTTRHHWTIASKMMLICGKAQLPKDSGKSNDQAIKWYLLSAKAADRGQDLEARVWVRGRAALALAYEGSSLDLAEQLATQAIQLAERPTVGQLTALLAHAHVAGCRGNARLAIARNLEARKLYDRLGIDDSAQSEFNVPRWRLDTFESMLLSRLGHPKAALAQDAADHSRPPQFMRFATHIELHRGLMMVASGDPAGGITYAREAMSKLPPIQRNHSLQHMQCEIEHRAKAHTKGSRRHGR